MGAVLGICSAAQVSVKIQIFNMDQPNFQTTKTMDDSFPSPLIIKLSPYLYTNYV